MSETTQGVELAVPDKAVTALEGHYNDVHRDLADLSGMMRETDDYVRAIAIPVVVAELRRLADDLVRGIGDHAPSEGEAEYWTGLDTAARALRKRADELEAQS